MLAMRCLFGSVVLLVVWALSGCERPGNVASAEAAAESAGPAQVQPGSLQLAVDQYRAWVLAELDELLRQTERFVLALQQGDVKLAKALYASARMHYERVEPVAEAFGELDFRIDGREADVAPGEEWTGFHAIEKILWTRHTTRGTDHLAQQLIKDVRELRVKAADIDLTPESMLIGAVDLLNEVSTSKIKGEEEVFSRTDLYDFKANIEGAEKIFSLFEGVLRKIKPELADLIRTRFGEMNALLQLHRRGGEFRSYDELTPEQIRALADAVHRLGEPLAQMALIVR